MSESKAPYVSLGNHLKYVREQSKQSLAEVSGAVEIDETKLARIEAGFERPDEEVLLLLISHFRVQDREAVQLWELANYDADMPNDFLSGPDLNHQGKQTIMLLAMDVRTMYSDGFEITANTAGVTLNFSQSVGKNQSAPIARVGMSREQAEQLLKALEKTLIKVKYQGPNKLLPPSL
ncbi:MAG TPA: helix-turn-helix transcriptional regulator [Candidatus Saccharimonadales bacterium]|nr:helix-turn-helix transcriptional regulator [Candidatus Saccharimonadales bacterium]